MAPYYLQNVPQLQGNYYFHQSEIVMGTGAEIRILNELSLHMDESHVHGCTHFWKSITVTFNGRLYMDETLLEHGEHNVKAEDGSHIYIQDCTFNNNYTGIYLPPPMGSNTFSIVHHSPIEHCNFIYDPSAPSLSLYPLQPAGNILSASRGIALERTLLFNVGGGTMQDENTFQNLFRGIRAFTVAELNVVNSRFTNVIGGIEVDGGTFPCKLNLTGFGLSGNLPTFFAGNPLPYPGFLSSYAVSVAKNCAVNIKDCISQGCTSGFLINNTNGLSHHISNNRIFCTQFGISLQNPGMAPAPTIIEHNYVETSGLSSAPRGINVSNSPTITTFSNNIRILNNRVAIKNSSSVGIMGNYSTNLLIESDTVELNHSNAAQGFSLTKCNTATVRGNRAVYTAAATPTNASMTSFRFWDCTQASLMECNITTSTRLDQVGTSIGFDFGGSSNTNAVFQGNKMGKHTIGLRHFSGYVGLQSNHGNEWLGQYTNPAFGTQTSDIQFKFEVPNGIPFQPVLLGVIGGGIFGPSWFESKVLPLVYFCEANRLADGEGGNQLSETEVQLVQTDPALPQYTESINWTADKGVYEKLDEIADSVALTGLEEAFYEAKSQESMGQLAQVTKETRNAMRANPQDSAELDALNEEYNTIKGLLGEPEFQLGNAIGLNDSLRIQEAIDSLLGSLDTLGTAIGVLAEQIKAENEQEFQELITQNAQIITGEVFDENQLVVNDISLATVAVNNYFLTVGQRDTLLTIALQCPLAGGVAVYEARFLYELMVEPLFVDDGVNCAGNYIQPRLTPAITENKITVSPNPASKALFVSFGSPLESGCEIILTNQLGVTVLGSRIERNLLSAFVVLSDIEDGVYGIQILDESGQILYVDKIVIIK